MVESEDLFRDQRLAMVAKQIQEGGVKDIQVLRAMQEVPRHLFVPEAIKYRAYADTPLEIGYGQTISQPYIVAFMTEALQVTKVAKVLEIGTGSGYQAAVLGKLVQEVYTIEIVQELGETSGQLLYQLGYTNVYSKIGNGYQGWPSKAPFDAIVVTAAANHIIPTLIRQLKVSGRIVMPLQEGLWDQMLIRIIKLDEKNNYKQERLLPVRFVPMTGQTPSM